MTRDATEQPESESILDHACGYCSFLLSKVDDRVFSVIGRSRP